MFLVGRRHVWVLDISLRTAKTRLELIGIANESPWRYVSIPHRGDIRSFCTAVGNLATMWAGLICAVGCVSNVRNTESIASTTPVWVVHCFSKLWTCEVLFRVFPPRKRWCWIPFLKRIVSGCVSWDDGLSHSASNPLFEGHAEIWILSASMCWPGIVRCTTNPNQIGSWADSLPMISSVRNAVCFYINTEQVLSSILVSPLRVFLIVSSACVSNLKFLACRFYLS